MPFKSRLQDYKEFDSARAVSGVSRHESRAEGIGSVMLTDPQGNRFVLKEVLYVPEAEKPIMSLAKAKRQGLLADFDKDSIKILR